ncbi:MAG: hypothetical protein R3B90_03200 [Planctomycetaceae bacterium]
MNGLAVGRGASQPVNRLTVVRDQSGDEMRSTSLLLLLTTLAAWPASSTQAGWPFSAEGPKRGTDEWYEMHAGDPVGQRQVYKFGKTWPIRPRPVGDPAPLVHQYHHNQYWPYPYQCADRASVEQFKHQQIANGWEEATTLYDFHFDMETQQLNSAGRERLNYILTKVPPEFRTAYVQASLKESSVTGARVSAVEQELAAVLGQGQMPPIMPRVTQPVGMPSANVNAIFQYRRDNLSPPPTLSTTPGTASGGVE